MSRIRQLRIVPWFTVMLLFVAALADAATLAERAHAAMLRVDVRPEQQEQFEKIMNDYYERGTAMIRREANTSPELVDQRVPRLMRTIAKDTTSKMQKILDPKQMEAFQYALDLENRRFMESAGAKEP